jgi:hypothetical protein
MFSKFMVATFKEFIHKFLEVYLDDWIVFSLLKDHIEVLRIMLDRCRQCHLSLNLKKCILSALVGILLAHVVCKQGILVDLTKIVVNDGFRTTYISYKNEGNSRPHTILQEVYQEICIDCNTNGNCFKEGSKFPMERGLTEGLGHIKEKMSNHADFYLSILEQVVPCSCRCIFHGIERNTILTKGGGHRSHHCVCK